MIWTLTFIVAILVAINFLLLVFSCNKTTKKVPTQQPIIRKETTILSNSGELAPTGS